MKCSCVQYVVVDVNGHGVLRVHGAVIVYELSLFQVHVHIRVQTYSSLLSLCTANKCVPVSVYWWYSRNKTVREGGKR